MIRRSPKTPRRTLRRCSISGGGNGRQYVKHAGHSWPAALGSFLAQGSLQQVSCGWLFSPLGGLASVCRRSFLQRGFGLRSLLAPYSQRPRSSVPASGDLGSAGRASRFSRGSAAAMRRLTCLPPRAAASRLISHILGPLGGQLAGSSLGKTS